MVRKLITGAILASLIAIPALAGDFDIRGDRAYDYQSGQYYDVGKTRSHNCNAGWYCGKSKTVETTTIYGADGPRYLRIYRDKRGDVTRIVVD